MKRSSPSLSSCVSVWTRGIGERHADTGERRGEERQNHESYCGLTGGSSSTLELYVGEVRCDALYARVVKCKRSDILL